MVFSVMDKKQGISNLFPFCPSPVDNHNKGNSLVY